METKWTKDEMLEEFDVLGFAFGFCMVKRKSDGVTGTLDFYTDDSEAHWVRYYYNWMEG